MHGADFRARDRLERGRGGHLDAPFGQKVRFLGTGGTLDSSTHLHHRPSVHEPEQGPYETSPWDPEFDREAGLGERRGDLVCVPRTPRYRPESRKGA